MLSARHRMRSSAEFSRVVRAGRRAGRPSVAVHLLAADGASPSATRVGLIVGRAVGGSVVRSQVSRRLRHLMRTRIDRLEPGSLLVVRATPLAAGCTSVELGVDLDGALTRVTHR